MITTRNPNKRLSRANKRGGAVTKTLKRLVLHRRRAQSAPAPLCGLSVPNGAPSAPAHPSGANWIDDIDDWFDLHTVVSTVSIPDYLFDEARPFTSSASSLFVDPSEVSSIDFYDARPVTSSASSLFVDPSEVSSIDSLFIDPSSSHTTTSPNCSFISSKIDSSYDQSSLSTSTSSSSGSFFYDFLAYTSAYSDEGYESDVDSDPTVSLMEEDSTVSLPVTSSASTLFVDPSEVSSMDYLFMDPSSAHSSTSSISLNTSEIFRRAELNSSVESIDHRVPNSFSYDDESDVDSDPLEKSTTVSPLKTAPCQAWKSRVLEECDEAMMTLARIEKKVKKE